MRSSARRTRSANWSTSPASPRLREDGGVDRLGEHAVGRQEHVDRHLVGDHRPLDPGADSGTEQRSAPVGRTAHPDEWQSRLPAGVAVRDSGPERQPAAQVTAGAPRRRPRRRCHRVPARPARWCRGRWSGASPGETRAWRPRSRPCCRGGGGQGEPPLRVRSGGGQGAVGVEQSLGAGRTAAGRWSAPALGGDLGGDRPGEQIGRLGARAMPNTVAFSTTTQSRPAGRLRRFRPLWSSPFEEAPRRLGTSTAEGPRRPAARTPCWGGC